MFIYSVCQQGDRHAKLAEPCQDACGWFIISDNMAVGAVADGVGSSKFADLASKIAIDKSIECCKTKLKVGLHDEEILSVIQQSFREAYNALEIIAINENNLISDYDTTLSLAVFRSGDLFFGHSGDSGIISFSANGLFKKVTHKQQDEYGRLFPLTFGEEYWVFSKHPDKAASVLLATDGIYDLFFPEYIRNEPISMYTALAEYFMDNLLLDCENVGIENVEKSMENQIANIPAASVNHDDKTMVVLIDPSINIARQDEDYYKEPDWDQLIRKYQDQIASEFYPDLAVKEKQEEEDLSDNESSTLPVHETKID